MRASAQRKVGGMAIVVTTAMATIIVNRFWLSAPIDRPTVAMITSVEPRAFMPQASASTSRLVRPPSSPPRKAPANLPTLAISDQAERVHRDLRIPRTVRSAVNPAMPKNTGVKNASDNAAQLLVDVFGQDRRFADQNAGDECAEHGMNADAWVVSAMVPMMIRMR